MRKMKKRICEICNQEQIVRNDSTNKICKPCSINKLNILPRRRIEMIDKQFGLLKVKEFSHIKNKALFWKCLCICGTITIVHGNKLRKFRTKSCGCLQKTKNELSNTKEIRSYRAMMARCYNPNNNRFHIYGSRGIVVCDEWKDSYKTFLEDMGKCPKGYSLDRIDNNGNYEPKNCRWSTNTIQSNNRNNNHIIEAFGEFKTLTEWAKIYKINWGTLRTRIIKLKWPIEKALFEAVKRK